jgi:hypothetical protein
VLQEMISNPTFSAARGKDRALNQPGEFYSSPEARRLNDATGGSVFHPNHSCYVEGFDGLQVWQNALHSTHVGALRCVSSLV